MILCASTQVFQGAELEISGLVSWQLMPALMFYIPATNGLSQTLFPRDSAVSAMQLSPSEWPWKNIGDLWMVSLKILQLVLWCSTSLAKFKPFSPGSKTEFGTAPQFIPDFIKMLPILYIMSFLDISRMSSILRQTHINASIWICPWCGFDVASCVQFSILV